MNSTELRDPASTKKTPVANPHAGKFRPVRSSYLSNTKYTGASSLAWYVLADPADMPVIEVAFLNGQQQPTVESAMNRQAMQVPDRITHLPSGTRGARPRRRCRG